MQVGRVRRLGAGARGTLLAPNREDFSLRARACSQNSGGKTLSSFVHASSVPPSLPWRQRRRRPCLRQYGRRSRAVPPRRAFSNNFGERYYPTRRRAVVLLVGHHWRCSVGVSSTTADSPPPSPRHLLRRVVAWPHSGASRSGDAERVGYPCWSRWGEVVPGGIAAEQQPAIRGEG